jgi:hypothetical protein
MNDLYKAIVLVIMTGLLSGCASQLTKSEIERIHAIGVLNSFPTNPTWTVIGTTILTNHFSEVEPRGYKELLSQITIDYLTKKGYTVKEIFDKNSTQNSDIDFRIELSPWDASQYVSTKGYGFVQRSFMGLKQGPYAYVVMHIVPRFKKGSDFGHFGKNSIYREQFEPLSISDMPSAWDKLPSATQDDLERSLKISIEKYLNEQLPKLGL